VGHSDLLGSRYTLYLLVVGQLFAVLEAPVTGFSDGVFLHLGILLHFAYRGLVDIGMNCRDCCDELDRTRLLPEALRKAQEPSQKQQGSASQSGSSRREHDPAHSDDRRPATSCVLESGEMMTAS